MLKILILSDFFAPGYRGGGVLRAVLHLVEHLKSDFQLRVLTRDHDLGVESPYSVDAMAATQVRLGCEISYLPSGSKSILEVVRVVRAFNPDVLYLNSCFSPLMTLLPLLLRAWLPGRILLAPRGELFPSALATKGLKKKAFLGLARCLGLYRGIHWHATCAAESGSIWEQRFGCAVVHVIPDLPGTQAGELLSPLVKVAGDLHILFLARLHPMKGLHRLLRLLPSIRGQVDLTIVGPEVDPHYLARCRELSEQFPGRITVSWEGALSHEEAIAAYGRAHLYVLPTESENHGYTIQESLLAGCPVLTSTGTPWGNLESEGAGWTLPLDARERWCEILQRVADQDEPEHLELRRAARQHGLKSIDAKAAVLATGEMVRAVAEDRS